MRIPELTGTYNAIAVNLAPSLIALRSRRTSNICVPVISCQIQAKMTAGRERDEPAGKYDFGFAAPFVCDVLLGQRPSVPTTQPLAGPAEQKMCRCQVSPTRERALHVATPTPRPTARLPWPFCACASRALRKWRPVKISFSRFQILCFRDQV